MVFLVNRSSWWGWVVTVRRPWVAVTQRRGAARVDNMVALVASDILNFSLNMGARGMQITY